MGIDCVIEDISPAIMFDQRARMFVANTWLSNQTSPETQYTMNTVNSYDGMETPLGATALVLPFADYGGNLAESPLIRDRFLSSESSNAPNWPAVNNVNANCHSPGLDSIYSDRTALGTPCSFIADQNPGSPETRSGRREHLQSTGSAYTYSPYSPREEDPLPFEQICTLGAPPFTRQDSLAVVEEVLGSSEDCNRLFLPVQQDDSQMPNCNESSIFSPLLSPRFNDQRIESTDSALTATTSNCEEEQFVASFCNMDLPRMLQCSGASSTSEPEIVQSNCRKNDAQTTASPVSEKPVATTSAVIPFTSSSCITTPLSVQREGSDIFTDSIGLPTNSLDTAAMLQDFLDTTNNHAQPAFTTLNFGALPAGCISQTTTNVEADQVTVPEQSTVRMDKNRKPSTSRRDDAALNPVVARRERNNAACRISRKRRRDKKLESEKHVVDLTKENAELQIQIERLETECKRVRSTFLVIASNNSLTTCIPLER